MMTNDYPPMDKRCLDAMLDGMHTEGPPCPWGCEVWGSFWPAFEDSPRQDHYRTGWQCPTCKRCWTDYERFGSPDDPEAYFTEMHAGWPPDAQPSPGPYHEPAN